VLLVIEPDTPRLRQILTALVQGRYSRQEVSSWQAAVLAEVGWQLALSTEQGYWYFYTLGHLLDKDIQGKPVLRDQDIREYIADLDGVPGVLEKNGITSLRSHQLRLDKLLWPLASYAIGTLDIESATGFTAVRGVFEIRNEVVQHCHLRFEADDYLLVKHLGPDDPDVFVLSSQRDQTQLQRFVQAIGL
jgi:hypothetical protein